MTEDSKIRALIVDDEPHVRRKLHKLLASHADVKVVGECDNGYEAVAAIEKQAPHLIFLDVKMQEIDGFDVLDQVEEALRPLVIFVTGYQEYAKRAFDVHAVDFLVKPLDQKRFDEALGQAKTWLASRREKDEQQHRAATGYRQRLGFKSSGRVFFLPTDKIEWIEAEAKYVRLHFEGKAPLLREPISTLEAQLDPDKFLRIHRSYIVNIDYIRELQLLFNQKYLVVLRDGTELPLSDSGRKKLEERKLIPC
jgi:two-component system, LytTR family, response regulator